MRRLFAKTVNGWLPLFSQKISIKDVWLDSKCFRRFYLLPSLDQAKSPSSRKMTRLVCSMIALEYESNNPQMTNTTNTWIGLFIVHLILEMYHLTALKVSKHGDFSGPYFPAFGLNTDRYGVFSPNAGKHGPEKTP